MRILLLTHTFNSLAQKIHAELRRRGHDLSVEYDISDEVTENAVEKFRPDLLIAPFLKRAIPESVWKNVLSLIIHPGPPGDRGPSSLDWAILDAEKNWGVTIIEASSVMDGGPIWAAKNFAMKNESKGRLYRHEIANAALEALLQAIDHVDDFKNKAWFPTPAHCFKERTRPSVRPVDRKINWQKDPRDFIIRKINSADGSPGVLCQLAKKKFYLYDAKEFHLPLASAPGIPVAICEHGVVINTISGPLTIGHLREKSTPSDPTFKKAAHHFFPELAPISCPRVRLENHGNATWVCFNFYNGAMGTKDCIDLRHAFVEAKKSPAPIIVLKSESGFFSNGIHLNEIEAAAVPADYAWENINAMNDLVAEVLCTLDKVTVALVDGNASAGGILLARAHDQVIGASHIVLNPHYKNMGNLYGSEYWTYLLPKYMGAKACQTVMSNRLPVEAQEALELGLIDHIGDFSSWQETMGEAQMATIILSKKMIHEKDEQIKPLAKYREEELARMRQNFYGFDPSFHVARYNFVRRIVKSKTPLHLATHRSIETRCLGEGINIQ